MEEKRKFCDVLIEPESMGATSIFEVGRAEEIYWLAYETTLKIINSNEKLKGVIKPG